MNYGKQQPNWGEKWIQRGKKWTVAIGIHIVAKKGEGWKGKDIICLIMRIITTYCEETSCNYFCFQVDKKWLDVTTQPDKDTSTDLWGKPKWNIESLICKQSHIS